jgi:hypothetical protein
MMPLYILRQGWGRRVRNFLEIHHTSLIRHDFRATAAMRATSLGRRGRCRSTTCDFVARIGRRYPFGRPPACCPNRMRRALTRATTPAGLGASSKSLPAVLLPRHPAVFGNGEDVMTTCSVMLERHRSLSMAPADPILGARSRPPERPGSTS